MSGKKLSPEEELEKQYQDYKAQFEQWKERNSESVGSDAYVRYVKQFEDWERDVEKRRAIVRQKAEQERMAAELESRREAERLRKRNEEKAAAQQAEAARIQSLKFNRKPTVVQQQPSSAHHASMATTSSDVGIRDISPAVSSNSHQQKRAEPALNNMEMSSMTSVMQQMLSFAMVAERQNGDQDRGNNHVAVESEEHVQRKQQPVAATVVPQGQAVPTTESQPPPQLWGSDGVMYSVTDPMFRRWNVRSAPPNFRIAYEPPPPSVLTNPYWYLVEKMKENKLILAPNFKHPPPPAVFPMKPPSLASVAVVNLPPPPTAAIPPPMFNIPPPNFTVPPPPSSYY